MEDRRVKYRSVFDIIGPIMIGPSSSHTAGATRIGHAARSLLRKQPMWARIRLYGSFARTYRGHGTDVAIVGGILDFDVSDPRIPQAIDAARQTGLHIEITPDHSPTEHPNTARVQLANDDEAFELVGISTGGGRIEVVEVNGFPVRLSGDKPAVLIFHRDRPGVIAEVAALIAHRGVNIAHMEVSRRELGGEALMIVEVDQPLVPTLMEDLSASPFVERATGIVG